MDHIRALSVEIGKRESGTPTDQAAADYIAGQLSELGWRVHKQVFGLPQGGESWNVIGDPPGFTTDEPYLLVGGHHDSLRGPGANDNGTGTAASLEIARALDAVPADIPVRAVLFGAEEIQPAPGKPHHVGSRYYVSKMGAESRKNLLMLMNLDEVGQGALVCGRLKEGPREGTERCLRVADELGVHVRERVTPDWSDNGAFLKEGLNAAWLWADDACCTHTPRDTIDQVDLGVVEWTGRLALAILRSYTD